jgi:RHS repeat-associated protein
VTNSGSETTIVSYKYDNNGNMVSKSTEKKKPVNATASGNFQLYKTGTTTESAVAFYKYDVWNQLAEAVSGDKKEKYKYNGEGYRVVKNDNNQVTNYLYEYDKVILETDNANNQLSRNVYGTNLVSRTSGSETLYYMYNGHADVTALIDNLGTIKGSYYYDAFGNILEQTGSVNNNITYAGYQYDSETGLYYLNARYYDSKIARFLSEDTYSGDPNDPLSLNLYTYCHNEPIMYWDPTGHYGDVIIDDNNPYPDLNNNTGIFIGGNCNLNLDVSTPGIVVTSPGANVTITISDSGSAGLINTSEGSNVTVNNGGNIGSVHTGQSSNTNINNIGFIGTIGFGAKSTNEINNIGYIGAVNSGGRTQTKINNIGYLGNVALGDGLSSLSINGVDVVQRPIEIDNFKLFNRRMGQNSQQWAKEMENSIYIFLSSPYVAKNSSLNIKLRNILADFNKWINQYNNSNDKVRNEMEINAAADALMWSIKQMVYTAMGYGLRNIFDKAPRTFTSPDKYVGETANAIEAKYPGKVVDVNKITHRSDGTILTDFDIELNNIVIQVKAGTAKGLTSQITKTTTGTAKEVIGYAPDLSPSSALVKNANKQGIKVFTSLDDLLNYLNK